MRQTVAQRTAILKSAAAGSNHAELVPLLTKALKDVSPFIRAEAIELVAENRVEELISAVEQLLKDRSEIVRELAVECFGCLGKGPVHTIRLLLRDKRFMVRIETLETLALLQDHGALLGMARLLSDGHPLVRAYAATSIAEIGAASYIQAIHDALDKETNDTARAGFLKALLQLGQKKYLEAFLNLLSSDNYRVRCYVANGLGDMPLDRSQLEISIGALSRARRHAIARADRTSVARVLAELKKGLSGQKHV